MKNKILIIGHGRSGHHLLADSIGINSSNYHDFVWLNIDPIGLSRTKVGYIYKNHGYAEQHKDYLKQILQEFHVFAPVRDGRDVMVSFFYFRKQHLFSRIPKNMSFQEFLHYNNNMYIFNWIRHVEGWLKQPVHFVKYEDMHYCFQETMTEVFKVLDEKRIKFRRPKFGEHYSKNNIQRKGL